MFPPSGGNDHLLRIRIGSVNSASHFQSCVVTLQLQRDLTSDLRAAQVKPHAHRRSAAAYDSLLFDVKLQRADILTTGGEGQRYSMLRLVNRVEFVSWSRAFSYVTMFGHVD